MGQRGAACAAFADGQPLITGTIIADGAPLESWGGGGVGWGVGDAPITPHAAPARLSSSPLAWRRRLAAAAEPGGGVCVALPLHPGLTAAGARHQRTTLALTSTMILILTWTLILTLTLP